MKIASLQQELQQNSYPGRGIVLGRSEDGKQPEPRFRRGRCRYPHTGI